MLEIGKGADPNRHVAGDSKVMNVSSEMDPEQLKEMQKKLDWLADWMRGLDATTESLNDPVALMTSKAYAEILHRIDPEFFDENFVLTHGSFSKDTLRAVKANAIRKLMRRISDYVSTVLHKKYVTDRWQDLDEKITGDDEGDLPVALNISMLIVTIAHIGDTKAEFVKYSQNMAAQNADFLGYVALCIEDVLSELNDIETKAEEDLSSINEDEKMSMSSKRNSHTGGRISIGPSASDELYQQIDDLQSERDSLKDEVSKLRSKVLEMEVAKEKADTTSDTKTTGSETDNIVFLEKQNEELRLKRRDAENRCHELEGQIEVMKPLMQQLTEDNDQLSSKNREISELQENQQKLKDELEIAREVASKASADAERLKTKDKEHKDALLLAKQLQQRLDHYVVNSTNEEENKEGIKTLRQQIGRMKTEIDSKDAKVISLEGVVTRLERDLVSTKERLAESEVRKEELVAERNNLQDKLLLSASTVNTNERTLHDSFGTADGEHNFSFDNGEKQKLEVANQRLLERIKELEQLEPLQGEVISLKGRNDALEQDYQVANKKKKDLEVQVAELQEQLDKSQQSVQSGVAELKVKLEKMSLDEERARQAAQKAENRLAETEASTEEKKKEVAKLEVALNNAKIVIDELEQRARPVGEEAGTSLQQFRQLQQENDVKDKKIQQLEAQIEQMATMHEQESRLITTAFHTSIHDRNRDLYVSTPSSRPAVASPTSSIPPTSILTRQKMDSALSWSQIVVYLMFGMLIGAFGVYQVFEQSPPSS